MMKKLALISLLFGILVATGYAQIIKTLGYNTTNGQIVAATNVVWTNAFSFSTNTVAAQVRTNVGLGWSALTNSNVTNFRTAIGLGETNDVEFRTVKINLSTSAGNSLVVTNSAGSSISLFDDIEVIELDASQGSFGNAVSITSFGIYFITNTAAATTRTNLGFPLVALTNTSNVTMMRALAGSTNTNHPFSGSVSVVGTNNTNTLVFSNGILQSVQ